MSLSVPSRRLFIKSLFVAPAIVAASNIMPVRAVEMFTNPKDDWVDYPISKAIDNLVKPTGLIGVANGTTSTTKLLTPDEFVGFNASNEWVLVEMGVNRLSENGNIEKRWVSRYTAEVMGWQKRAIKTVDVGPQAKSIDTTVALMKAEPGSGVIWDMPGNFSWRG